MAYKAHRHLLNYCGYDTDKDDIARAIARTTAYNTVIGNSYTASVYLALAALLDQADDLTGRPVGLFSYGSGSVAEFFAATVVAGYREHLRTGPSSGDHPAQARRLSPATARCTRGPSRPTAATTPPRHRPPGPSAGRAQRPQAPLPDALAAP
ncbi:hydroxymethylglutaryl-CoA synthase [Streptomyces sp. DG2A-72]|uniref:hydroxymethylglutaryl-CoA synthase n=1 Tax=Streptomyces sp. DG2A-72 TaxID=3051386 RepID=UPI00265C583B|nr:hydroxymethylglutaryl-CoA synthase [Streptomyces sp. DG2A-72]MDO0939225.1 hydroxymethylglutaryl-CoA synthase [Streptomyces sp. DG2A-72]